MKINQGLQIPISKRLLEPKEGALFYITNEFLNPKSDKRFYIEDASDTVICNEDDILMTRTGNTGKVVTNVAGAFHNNFFRIAYPKSVSKIYLYNFLLLPRIQNLIVRLAGTSTIPDLNHSDFYKIKFVFPSIEEQRKIAVFIDLLDKRIETQNKIIQGLESLSIGLKERVFSRKLNFKKKDGSSYPKWALKKLGNFLTIPLKESPDKINPSQILTVKLHLKGILLNDRVDSLKLGATKYIIRRKGQFIYGKQNLFNGAFGIVPDEFDGFLSSGDVPSLDINCELINPMFLYHFLGRETYYKRFEAIASGSGSKRIHENTLLSHRILTPSIEEQNKIASFLTTIEEKIQMEKDILQSLQSLKQYLLQQLFV